MKLNTHYELKGQHALLAPSNYYWLNYDPEKMAKVWVTKRAAALGDRKHAIAAELIDLGMKLPPIKKTMNLYVNDCIGFRMTPEQPLFYSWNCFGTADALSFRKDPVSERLTLRIFDLKTGSTRTSFKQLLIYAALFFLEYDIKPADVDVELRIYKSDDCEVEFPDLESIVETMSTIRAHSALIDSLKEGSQ